MRRPERSSWVLGLLLGFLAAAATMSAAAAAKDKAPPELRFARIFTDHMVLQQDKPIRVWGWARPGAKVTVTLTQDRAVGEAAVAEAAEPERDRKRRRPEPAEVEDGYSVTVRYVEKNPPKLTARTLQAQAGGDGRWAVEFKPAKASFLPTWIIARSGGGVIAAGDVVIGEVWLCAGQSNMAWSNFNRKDREAASADFPGLRYVAWDDSWYKPLDDVRRNVTWQVCSPESAQKFSAVPYLYGMFLHRYLKVPVGIINVARGGTLGQTWCLREELDSIDNVIVKTVLKDYDAQTATWEDPKQVERIMADWEKACERVKAEHPKKVAAAKAKGRKEPRLRLPKKPGDPRSGWSPPAGLFNATVMPIRRLGVRGVLYYQGENNNFMRWTRYEHTFPKVPVSFRKAFGDEKLAFGCISQPGWGTFGLDPEVATVAEGYAIVRDIQRRALAADPHAGMIATYPTGNSYIHPAEKLPVAEYASLWALANVYDKRVMHRGTTYREMKNKGGKLYLFFDVDPIVKGMIKPDREPPYWLVLPCAREGRAPLEGFIIAGEDRRWYPAKARHAKLDGEHCVEVWSDLVGDPVAVRYGWANWPTGNLVGRNRLPMPTFRTDDWPIPKGANYSKEVAQQCSEDLRQLRAEAEKQALDRKVRQMQVDLPKLETELHLRKNGSPKKLIESKIARMAAVLDELEKDEWLSRHITRSQPELAAKIEAARGAVEALKAQAAKIEEKE
jgi:sialate O-acetylesterase